MVAGYTYAYTEPADPETLSLPGGEALTSLQSLLAVLDLPANEEQTTVDNQTSLRVQCGWCEKWISTNAKSAAKTAANLHMHRRSKECSAIQKHTRRIISRLAAAQTSPITPIVCPTITSHRCPGIPLDWAGEKFHHDYPWHKHDGNLEWDIDSYNCHTKQYTVRARKCSYDLPPGQQVCLHCSALSAKIANKHNSLHSDKAKSLPYERRTHAHLLLTIVDRDEKLKHHRTAGLNYSARIEKLEEKLKLHSQLVQLLATRPVPRLHQIISVHLRQGSSISAMTDRIKDALSGEYSATGSFSEREKDLSLLALDLGGHQLLYALSNELNLPSARTVMRSHQRSFVDHCIARADDETMTSNITQHLLNPQLGKQRPRVGSQIALDETAIRPGASHKGRHVTGLCFHDDSQLQMSDLEINSFADLERLAALLFPPNGQEPQCHFATQATVVAFNLLNSRDNYHSVPFLICGCCLKKDATTFQNLIKQLIRVWENSGAKDHFGYFWCISTDGDPGRRRGGFALLLQYKLDRYSDLGRILYKLRGMNFMTGPHLITLNFDWKHLIKRE